MRFLAALSLCLLVSSVAQAKPSGFTIEEFRGDRWIMAQGASAQDVTRSMSCPPPHCGRVKAKRKWKKPNRHERATKAARSGAVIVPLARVLKGVRKDSNLPLEQGRRGDQIHRLVDSASAHPAEASNSMRGVEQERAAVRRTLLGGLAREIGDAFGVPQRFVRGRLICAANVNAALAERGIRGTDSRLAKSFLKWGRKSQPVPGAVAIFNRGRNPRSGHVAIVHSVKPNGTVIYLNPSSRRQAWTVGPYRGRPIAFRVAS